MAQQTQDIIAGLINTLAHVWMDLHGFTSYDIVLLIMYTEKLLTHDVFPSKHMSRSIDFVSKASVCEVTAIQNDQTDSERKRGANVLESECQQTGKI